VFISAGSLSAVLYITFYGVNSKEIFENLRYLLVALHKKHLE